MKEVRILNVGHSIKGNHENWVIQLKTGEISRHFLS